MNKIINLTEGIHNVFNTDSIPAKRRLLSELGANLVWNSEKLNIYCKKSIQILIDGMKSIKSDFIKSEPKIYPYIQGSNEKITIEMATFSKMLPR